MAHVLFTLFVCVRVLWRPTHIALCLFVFILCLVYLMFPVSLDCPFVIGPSVFSNVYLLALNQRQKLYKKMDHKIYKYIISRLYLFHVAHYKARWNYSIIIIHNHLQGPGWLNELGRWI